MLIQKRSRNATEQVEWAASRTDMDQSEAMFTSDWIAPIPGADGEVWRLSEAPVSGTAVEPM